MLTQPQSKDARSIIYIERISIPDKVVDDDDGHNNDRYTCKADRRSEIVFESFHTHAVNINVSLLKVNYKYLMLVFTWNSFDQSRVYDVDSFDKIYQMFELIALELEEWGFTEKMIEKHRKAITDSENKLRIMVQGAIEDILKEVVGKHECFETGTGFSHLIDPLEHRFAIHM